METLFGKALGDLANLVKEKWYAGMGFIGLLLFAYVLMFGVAQDDILVGAISLAMMGFGFGEAELRSFQKAIHNHMGHLIETTKPLRRFNAPATCLFTVGGLAAATAIGRAIYLVL